MNYLMASLKKTAFPANYFFMQVIVGRWKYLTTSFQLDKTKLFWSSTPEKFHVRWLFPFIVILNISMNSSQHFTNHVGQCTVYAEEILIASLVLIISVLYCIPYTMCIYIMLTDKIGKMPYYKIVLSMGVSDLIQLVFNGVFAGIFTYFCVDFSFGGWRLWVNKVIGEFSELFSIDQSTMIVLFTRRNIEFLLGGLLFVGTPSGFESFGQHVHAEPA